jgi:hypothetical protein
MRQAKKQANVQQSSCMSDGCLWLAYPVTDDHSSAYSVAGPAKIDSSLSDQAQTVSSCVLFLWYTNRGREQAAISQTSQQDATKTAKL